MSEYGETQRKYRDEADKYDSEWLSPDVTGDEPKTEDTVQGSSPVNSPRGLGKLFGRK